MTDFFRSIFDKFFRLPKVLRGKDFYVKTDSVCNHITYGNLGAAWTFCPDFIDEKSIIYSFGVGEDVSFDLALINNFDVIVHAFDPTPKSIKWVKKQNLPKQFMLHEYGLANFNGKTKFHPPENPNHISATLIDRPATKNEAYKVAVKSLDAIMNELQHTQIDLLKIDIEGAEYLVIEDIIKKEIKPTQLLIEFHHRFENIGLKATKAAIKNLRKFGYSIFFVSKTGEEISFIRKDLLKN
jgi:FkbM family methyltransferase